MNSKIKLNTSQEGFSLLELIIAMAVTVVIAGAACSLLAQALKVRSRSNEKTDALADAERALNIMSREIANSGFNLDDNGLVAGDCVTDANGNSTIRVRANLNKFDSTVSTTAQQSISVTDVDLGEDVKYFLYPTANTNLLARYDAYDQAGGTSTVLANRLDSIHIHYFTQRVTYSTPSPSAVGGCDISSPSATELATANVASAKYVVIAVCVDQPAVGAPGSEGYQPASKVLLVSDVALRNANLTAY